MTTSRRASFVPDPPRIIRGDGGRDVVRIQTPSGVVGYIATCIPDEVLDAFIKKLRRKMARRQRREGAPTKPGSRCGI
jgi:hypothetical protein